jgi:hypothetical protein
MKHMFLKSVTSLVLVISVMLAACSKGDTGPAGEQGEKGDAGPTGKTGSANVIASDWLSVTYSAASDSTGGAAIEVPKLTDSIVRFGAVKTWVLQTIRML